MSIEASRSVPPAQEPARVREPDQFLVPSVHLAEKLDTLPSAAGVYLHKDRQGNILYVGKAKNLRSRVRSYFQQGRPRDAKTRALVSKIHDIECIVTDSEVEALILENTLIKEHQPRYNILLKDDKTYPYIRVTHEPFPRIIPTRRIIRDGSKYFGPYTETKHMHAVLGLLKSLFRIRSCDLALTKESIAQHKFKVCLDYQIHRCDGPCEGLISQEEYARMIKQAMQILRGKSRAVENELMQEMERLSEALEFEKAALVRNRLIALREYSQRQKVLSTDPIDRDVIALAHNDNEACVVCLSIRDGKLLSRQHFYIAHVESIEESTLIHTTCERLYLERDDVPEEILVPVPLDDTTALETWLSSKRGAAVRIHTPQAGDKRKLVALAATNAEFLLKERILQRMKREQDKSNALPRAVLALQRDLRLAKPPRRIECFDNSHLQGSETVSSMVVFVDGKPQKSEYRKFKLRTVVGIDDFQSMQEVLRRRYQRMLDEHTEQPDLIVVDGGKGQLSHAVEVLRELGLYGTIPVIGLAKRLEEIVLPFQSETLLLPKTSSSLRLLQQIRDEAHRFAIEFHRSLRDKRTLQTELTQIQGIGEKIAQKLLAKFGSVEGVRTASDEDLQTILNAKTLARVRAYFAQRETHHPA
ncbi:MAG: excinuclease ABC subunit UvrC [Bacteroidota bacterium]|nr:excinuclease ABC subunit UvrC [Candidatus Kapabacteria bacterium]MDW8219738.1 excinuclease ABC subunit UvrC [Bacteroidota bacterium]